jgi:hypothetical protein
MLDRDQYRKKAESCIAQAEMMRDPQERASILAIAQLYLKLAERVVGRYDQATAHRQAGEAYPEHDS